MHKVLYNVRNLCMSKFKYLELLYTYVIIIHGDIRIRRKSGLIDRAHT